MSRSMFVAACGLAVSGAAWAQCESPVWQQRFTTAESGLVTGEGTPGTVRCMQVFDPDGAGPMPEELYVAGHFFRAGGIIARQIARWNGTSWSSVGAGLTGTSPMVEALGVHDFDGTGPGLPVLVAAGRFTSAGGVAVSNIAAWNGVSWSALGTPPPWHFASGISSIDLDGNGPDPADWSLARKCTTR